MYVSAVVMGNKESARKLSPDGLNIYRKARRPSLADWFGAGRQALAELRARQAQLNGEPNGG